MDFHILKSVFRYIIIVDPAIILFSSKKRAVHDLIAVTYVVAFDSYLEYKKASLKGRIWYNIAIHFVPQEKKWRRLF